MIFVEVAKHFTQVQVNDAPDGHFAESPMNALVPTWMTGVTMVALVLLSDSAAKERREDLIQRIREESRLVWAKATERSYVTTYEQRHYDLDHPNDPYEHWRGRIARSPGRGLLTRELVSYAHYEKKRPKSYAKGFNEKYLFDLEQPFGQKAWLIDDCLFSQDAVQIEKRREFINPNVQPHFVHLALNSVPIHEVFTTPGFKLVSIGTSPDSAALVRLNYEHVIRFSSYAEQRIVEWVDIDPGAGWCIKKVRGTSEYQQKGRDVEKWESDTVCGYELHADSTPVLRKIETWSEKSGGKDAKAGPRRTYYVGDFLTNYDVEIPEEECTLSAFGLPEPMGVTWEKPTPMYVWLLLAAAVCAVLAFALRWFIQRRQKRAAS